MNETMFRPTVSVIIPVRDGTDVLPDCLAALARQSYPADCLEVIVVDDASTDGTSALVRSEIQAWSQRDINVRLRLIEKPWGGAGAARNRGVREATGEIVLFTDADCEPTLSWVEEMIAPLADLRIQAVAGGYLTRQSSKVARLAQAEFEDRYRHVAKNRYIDIAFTHSCAVRREVFLDSQGFDERIPNNADDLELSYRLAQRGHLIVFAPRGLVYHRHPATWSDYIRKKIGRGYWRTLVFKRYPGKLIRDSYTPQTLKLQILLAGLALPLTLLGLIGVPLAPISALLCWGLLFASTLPFVLRLADPGLKLLAPGFLIVQAAAIGWGTFRGLTHRIEDYVIGGKKAATNRAP